jgi:uncharacterized protein (TIGR02453 family)
VKHKPSCCDYLHRQITKKTESEAQMENSFNLEPVLNFLDDLSKHNNKAWFDQNRVDYENARELFEQFIDYLIDEFRASDGLQDLSAKDCISRIYRDLRFSKDKSPYKTNMWATIAPGGKKATRMGYHIALQPQRRSLIAGGMWEPSPEQLDKFRQAIAKDASGFKKVTRAKSFLDNFGKVEGERLKTAPQGYDRTHPEIELLQLKQIVVVHYYSDNQVLAHDFPGVVISSCRAMRPFLDYLNSIV